MWACTIRIISSSCMAPETAAAVHSNRAGQGDCESVSLARKQTSAHTFGLVVVVDFVAARIKVSMDTFELGEDVREVCTPQHIMYCHCQVRSKLFPPS